jgi:hypothetical protein
VSERAFPRANPSNSHMGLRPMMRLVFMGSVIPIP